MGKKSKAKNPYQLPKVGVRVESDDGSMRGTVTEVIESADKQFFKAAIVVWWTQEYSMTAAYLYGSDPWRPRTFGLSKIRYNMKDFRKMRVLG